MTDIRLQDLAVPYHTSFVPGFMTGATTRFDFDRWGVMADFLFTQKGWRGELETVDATSTQRNRIYYGELLALPYFKWRNFFAMAGPGMSYGLWGKSHQVFNRSGQTYVNDWPVTFTEATSIFNRSNYPQTTTYMDRRLTINWQVGLGVMAWEWLMIDVRYQEAMMDHHSPMPPSQRPSRIPAGWYQSLQLSTAVRLSKG